MILECCYAISLAMKGLYGLKRQAGEHIEYVVHHGNSNKHTHTHKEKEKG
jgi:hypothetical protein